MSNGCICCVNTSPVSQAGCVDASQAEHASACRCREAACLARLSELCAATRPRLAALIRRSVAPPMAHSPQFVRPIRMTFPHPRQRFSLRGGGIGGGSGDLPFATRLCRCVKRVGSAKSRNGFRSRDHSVPATHSAIGATARPQVGAVSESLTASAAISRQLPSRCSRNHSRLRGSRVTQSTKNPSIWGRTTSIRSQARLSRAGVST